MNAEALALDKRPLAWRVVEIDEDKSYSGRCRREKQNSRTREGDVTQIEFALRGSSERFEGFGTERLAARNYDQMVAMDLPAMTEGSGSRGSRSIHLTEGSGYVVAAIEIVGDVGELDGPSQFLVVAVLRSQVFVVPGELEAVAPCTWDPNYDSKTEAMTLVKLRRGANRTSGSAPKTAPWFSPPQFHDNSSSLHKCFKRA